MTQVSVDGILSFFLFWLGSEIVWLQCSEVGGRVARPRGMNGTRNDLIQISETFIGIKEEEGMTRYIQKGGSVFRELQGSKYFAKFLAFTEH